MAKFQVLVKFQKILFINLLLKPEIKPVDQKKKKLPGILVNTNVAHHQAIRHCCHPERIQMEKNMVRSFGVKVYIKGMFSVSNTPASFHK